MDADKKNGSIYTMKTANPPMLIGAALIFWGWQTGLWIIATIMALCLEGARLVRFRWDFSPAEQNRISDLCAAIFMGMLVWLVVSHGSSDIIFVLAKWLPMALFPMIFCQLYSVQGRTDLRAISMFLRKRPYSHAGDAGPLLINLSYPYFGICLLAASFANREPAVFYCILSIFTMWAFWNIRRRTTPAIIWIILFALAVSGGYIGQAGLQYLQKSLEARWLEWFYDLGQKNADPYHAVTAIGYIGSLKPSNRILFRVKTASGDNGPFLLREASYDRYRSANWFSRADFQNVKPEPDEMTWNLSIPSTPVRQITITDRLREGQAMLRLPASAFRISGLPVLHMERNPLGAVRVKDGPELIIYRADSGSQSPDVPPDEHDIQVSEPERPAVERIIRELDLKNRPPEQVIARLSEFFEKNFTYSLNLSPHRAESALADFLDRSRSGHCEYFATATVLLLRAAGVPARYAVGYSAHEFSELEGQIVVRKRHAHAWTQAFVSGTWQDVDNTPGNWRAAEDAQNPAWQSAADIWEWVALKIAEWRWNKKRFRPSAHLLWLLVPAVLLLFYRLYLKKRVIRKPEKADDIPGKNGYPGTDSDFYRIIEWFEEKGICRLPGEPVLKWLERVEKQRPADTVSGALYPIIRLHYRYRFDPEGISPEEKALLRRSVQVWFDSPDSLHMRKGKSGNPASNTD